MHKKQSANFYGEIAACFLQISARLSHNLYQCIVEFNDREVLAKRNSCLDQSGFCAFELIISCDSSVASLNGLLNV